MGAETKRRFFEVQLEIEKLLLEFIRKLRTGSGRYEPIAIRPMMLGKTDADADAKAYMVVICSENIERKVQDFFGDTLVKSLCDPDDDDVPSFEALVIGRALRLRTSTSDINVHSGAVDCFHDGTETFCGMPIRLCDDFGHLRNATFGGIVKVTSTDGDYKLYGLTAGHMIRDYRVITLEDGKGLASSDGSDLTDIELGERLLKTFEVQTGTTDQTMGSDIDQGCPGSWCFSNEYSLGKILDTDGQKALANEEQSRMKPYLDWALFEVNAYRPNQLTFQGRVNHKGDLRLPVSNSDRGKDEVDVSLLCASPGVKYGVLSTTTARVLLDPGDCFTDTYTISLEGSHGKNSYRR